MPLSVLQQGDLAFLQLPSVVQQAAASGVDWAEVESSAAAHMEKPSRTAVVVNANFFIGLHSAPNLGLFQPNFPAVSEHK